MDPTPIHNIWKELDYLQVRDKYYSEHAPTYRKKRVQEIHSKLILEKQLLMGCTLDINIYNGLLEIIPECNSDDIYIVINHMYLCINAINSIIKIESYS